MIRIHAAEYDAVFGARHAMMLRLELQARVDEMLARHDEKFERTLEYVLRTNAELYKCLA